MNYDVLQNIKKTSLSEPLSLPAANLFVFPTSADHGLKMIYTAILSISTHINDKWQCSNQKTMVADLRHVMFSPGMAPDEARIHDSGNLTCFSLFAWRDEKHQGSSGNMYNKCTTQFKSRVFAFYLSCVCVFVWRAKSRKRISTAKVDFGMFLCFCLFFSPLRAAT